MTPPDSVGKVRMPDHWSRGEIALGAGPDGPWVPLADYQSLQAELTRLQALDRQRQEEVNGLQAARMAYASEFPLNADGEPDVGNIHANIRAMKAALAEARELLHETGRYLDPRHYAAQIAKLTAFLTRTAKEPSNA